MMWPLPTPEEQVHFLRNIQRLLSEGLFVASYKFALVHALADLSVLKGQDSGAPLDISTKEIAGKFVAVLEAVSPLPGGRRDDQLYSSAKHGKAGGDHLADSRLSAGMWRVVVSAQANGFYPLVIAGSGGRSGREDDATLEAADDGR
jgi:hypothetical protein